MTQSEQVIYEKALQYAEEKHKGQKRIGGQPYITHPLAVAEYVREWGYGLEYQITGLFHDLLEDTDATEQEILALGGAEVLDAVKRLTKGNSYVMADYVTGIRECAIARVVKTADRLHNLRCAHLASEKFRRRYIAETREWYLDFSEEIAKAVEELAGTLGGQQG